MEAIASFSNFVSGMVGEEADVDTGTLVWEYRMAKSFPERKREGLSARRQYPNHVPVVVQLRQCSFDLDRKRLLVGADQTVGGFLHILRKRGKVGASTALFIIADGGALPPLTATMRQVHRENKADDGLLYVLVQAESTFGRD